MRDYHCLIEAPVQQLATDDLVHVCAMGPVYGSYNLGRRHEAAQELVDRLALAYRNKARLAEERDEARQVAGEALRRRDEAEKALTKIRVATEAEDNRTALVRVEALKTLAAQVSCAFEAFRPIPTPIYNAWQRAEEVTK